MNPFEDENSTYLVLVNDEDQHSLWPASIVVPDGWRSVLGPASRRECLDYVNENWRDMRPRSLAKVMDDSVTAGQSPGD